MLCAHSGRPTLLQSGNSMPSHDHKVGRPLRAPSHSTTNINVRLTDDENEALRWHAERLGVPLAVLVRQTLGAAGLFSMSRKRGG